MGNVAARLEGADRRWGYRFDVDGVLTTKEACELTGYTYEWLRRLHDKGVIRKRRGAGGRGRIEWSKRSILDYCRPVEV